MKETKSACEENNQSVADSRSSGPHPIEPAGTTLQNKVIHQGKVRRRKKVYSPETSTFRNVMVNYNPNVLVRKASALEQCEKLIEAASPTIVEVCLTIAHIRKQKLFWPAYETIEAYIKDCWHLQDEHIHRVLAVVEVIEKLSPIGEIVVPGNENEVRELLGFWSRPKPRKKQRNAPSPQSTDDHLPNAEPPRPLAKFVEKIAESVRAGQPEEEILKDLQLLKLKLQFCGFQ